MGRGASTLGPGRLLGARRTRQGHDRARADSSRPRGPPAGRQWHRVHGATNLAGHWGRCGALCQPDHHPRDLTGALTTRGTNRGLGGNEPPHLSTVSRARGPRLQGRHDADSPA